MPQPLIIYESGYATVYFHPKSKIVHHEFHKPAEGEYFRNTLNAGLDAFRDRGGAKWLSDDRRNNVVRQDDEVWARTSCVPAVQAAGWQQWAIVKPMTPEGQLNMNRHALNFATLGINTRFFQEPAEALAWLVAQ